MAGFLLAVAVLFVRLRPDPLLMARQIAVDAGDTGASHGSVRRGLREIRQHPLAMLGLGAVAVGYTVMVSVMVMTSLHMHHGGAELRLIGLVISAHVFGMYAFSPVMGWLVDRVGGRLVVLGSLGGGLSGVVVGVWGYPTLCLIAAALSVGLGLRALAATGIPVR